jgi:CheY-like chemotaxis protein
VAEDGEQSVDLFASWRPHFIWMDLRLPGISGAEAAQRIRGREGGRDIKIVALTASVFSTQRDEVLAAGLDGFLRKPYRAEEIFDCMGRLLGVRYVYGEDLPRPAVSPSLSPDSLAALPQDVREELAAALVRLEPGPIAAAIGRVSDRDAVLGSALACYADQLAYTAILTALESANGRAAQGGA